MLGFSPISTNPLSALGGAVANILIPRTVVVALVDEDTTIGMGGI